MSNYPPGVTDSDEAFNLSSVEDDDDERCPIPCCMCGKETTWDPTYGDLCYRCIRADNE